MNEKKLTALISVLAFGLAGMALVPVGMDAGAEHAPLAQANEGTDHCIETESIPEGTIESDIDVAYVDMEYGTLRFILQESYNRAALAGCGISSTVPLPEEYILEIPSEVNGLPVVAIAEYACQNCKHITGVVIPDTVIEIADSTFAGCSRLKTVSIPESVQKIGNYAFTFTSLQSVTLPDNLSYLGDYAFRGSSLKSVVIPDSLTYFGLSAFSYSCLESVTISPGVPSVPAETFLGCSSLKQVVFPETPLEIGENAFSETGLTEMIVPSNVTLGEAVFANSKDLQKIEFCDHVQIPPNTLDGCKGLRELTFSGSVTELNESLGYWLNLDNTYFRGSVDEWNRIALSDSDRRIIFNGNFHIDSYANLNDDMSIDAADAAIILNASAQLGSGAVSGLTEQQISDADVNFDSKYDAQDAATILRYAAAFGTGEKVTLADFLNE